MEVIDKDIERMMEMIDLHAQYFPHLTKQGYKIKDRLTTRINYGYLLNDSACILYEVNTKRDRIIKKANIYKKKKDMILHQIASDGSRKGAARELLVQLIDICRVKGCENIILSVRQDNIKARLFYERNNFELIYENNWVWTEKGTPLGGCIYKLNIPNSNKIYDFFGY
jgi:GNAT superfamily N-acetyltransferase